MLSIVPAMLWADPIARAIGVAFIGLFIGSFLNVVIYRLPLMLAARWQRDSANYLGVAADAEKVLNLWWPPSYCPLCSTAVRAWHNIPLFGFVLLRGRCAVCKSRIAIRYPFVEALTALLFAFVAWHIFDVVQLIGALLMTSLLVALSFIDLETQLLPDELTQSLLWTGLTFHLFDDRVLLADAVIGAVAGYLILWLLYWIFRLITGKEGMGYGDFKLLAALGAWLGWQMLPLILLMSSLTGAIIGGGMLALSKHQRGQALPFGPYLAAAGWLAITQGEAINLWYINVL